MKDRSGFRLPVDLKTVEFRTVVPTAATKVDLKTVEFRIGGPTAGKFRGIVKHGVEIAENPASPT